MIYFKVIKMLTFNVPLQTEGFFQKAALLKSEKGYIFNFQAQQKAASRDEIHGGMYPVSAQNLNN